VHREKGGVIATPGVGSKNCWGGGGDSHGEEFVEEKESTNASGLNVWLWGGP